MQGMSYKAVIVCFIDSWIVGKQHHACQSLRLMCVTRSRVDPAKKPDCRLHEMTRINLNQPEKI